MAARTEREIILAHTNHWFRHSEWSVEKFGLELLAPALAAADLVEQLAEPETGAEYMRSRKAWGQRLNRVFNGTAPFPLEWKGVWLQCLPEEYAREALRDCLALFDVPNLRVPAFSPAPVPSVPSRFGELMQEFGQFVAASTPAHNGRYDRNDDPVEVERMLKEGTDAVLAMISELMAIAAGTGRSLPALQLLVSGAEVANV